MLTVDPQVHFEQCVKGEVELGVSGYRTKIKRDPADETKAFVCVMHYDAVIPEEDKLGLQVRLERLEDNMKKHPSYPNDLQLVTEFP